MIKYEQHEIGKLMPRMSTEDFTKLKSRIVANGYDHSHPIVLFEGRVLDGWHRANACYELNVEPSYVQFLDLCKEKFPDPYSFVDQENEARRHLTMTQRAFYAIKMMPELEREARERMRFVGKSGMYVDTQAVTESIRRDVETGALSQNFDYLQEREKLIKGKAAELAEEKYKVNRQYISDAKKIEKSNPELAEKCFVGDVSITEAKRIIERQEAVKVLPKAPSDKYRVIYADPPWSYNDSRDGLESATGAASHYPTMSLKDICNLPVNDWTEPNAVLFLWITSPLLFQANEVIKAWNFKYKTSFVWDKIKHNMGHYNSVRHEFLLIATKGSCLPDSNKLVDSVLSIERTTHSTKPKEFRELIDQLYTHGNKLEMFARTKAEGWSVYGNEIIT